MGVLTAAPRGVERKSRLIDASDQGVLF